MGLGKTIEALAAIGHLHAGGATHFLVVCPASVLVNWLHETDRHTKLEAFRLHGSDRNANFKLWARRGGIGVTTFGTPGALPEADGVKVSLLVVDEAHYIKNPRAFRTQDAKWWMTKSKRTLFLSGTPMENRVAEFRTLVDHLNPGVASGLSAFDGLAGANAFRAAVAPVGLRARRRTRGGGTPCRPASAEGLVRRANRGRRGPAFGAVQSKLGKVLGLNRGMSRAREIGELANPHSSMSRYQGAGRLWD
jgi:hypothetical protein